MDASELYHPFILVLRESILVLWAASAPFELFQFQANKIIGFMSCEKFSSIRTKTSDFPPEVSHPENLPNRKEMLRLSVQPDLTFSVETPSRETK